MCLSFLHGSRPCECTFSVALALLIPIARFLCNCQASTITTITAKTMFVRQDGPNVVKIPTGVTKHMRPLERELEAVEGISLAQLGQPLAEVVGRVSVVTPTTASRARFYSQLPPLGIPCRMQTTLP